MDTYTVEMPRDLLRIGIAALLVVVGFFVTVSVLNATLYSPSGFVRDYLDALARHDSDGALALAGETAPAGRAAALLQPSAMGELSDIRFVSDTTGSEGSQQLVFSYTAGGTRGQSTFDVKQNGALFGLFPAWRFAASPIGAIRLSVLHGEEFAANGVQLRADSPTAEYAAFVPGAYSFDHQSEYLAADPLQVVTSEPSATVVASLDIRPTQVFVDTVQKQVNDYLDSQCVTQQVLLPTGCPFGAEVNDRTVSPPIWSIVTYPVVRLDPLGRVDWRVLSKDAVAHLGVKVQSLFDGSISALEKDVPFSLTSSVSLQSGVPAVTGGSG